MADIRIQTRVIPAVDTADGAWLAVQGYREGSISAVDFFQRMATAGRLFGAEMGTVTTPLTFLASAANRPDAWIRVPSGTAIIPVYAGVTLESAAGTVTEIDVRICRNDIGNGTSSAASVGPLALRTDAPNGAGNCTARQLATADTTAETSPLSIYRRTYARADEAGIDWRGIEKDFRGKAPLLIGAATWEIFVAATTTQATGFVLMQWVETPSSWWT